MKLFKLLEDYNEEFVQTQCNFKHKSTIGSNYVLSPKETLFWAQRHTHILLFQRSFFRTTLHHRRPAFQPEASAGLDVTVLYVPQRRARHRGDERGYG